jgi:hypothetical protein
MEAIYVSVWDNGDNTFRTKCQFNPETKDVTDIEQADVEGIDLNYLDEEYIELPNGEQVKEFTIEGEEH